MVTVTQKAASKIRELLAEEQATEVSVLRIAVQGGGCSGFQYALGFDRGPQDGDNEVEMNGVRVVTRGSDGNPADRSFHLMVSC